MASNDMSSATTASGKTAPESGYMVPPSPPPPPNYFRVDVSLRVLLLAASVTALVVMVTSKQTKHFPTNLPPPYPVTVTKDAYFKYSPALVYLVVALSVTSLYSIITIVTSAFVVSNPSPSPKLLFNLIISDMLMLGVMASATGSAGSVAYVGLKGNSHIGWDKICNKFGKFCRHVGSSAAVSLVASGVLVLLVVLSSYSMYRRAR